MVLPDHEWIVPEAIHAQYLYISAATHPDAASSVGDTTLGTPISQQGLGYLESVGVSTR